MSIAQAVMRELALENQFDMIAIAKKDEKKGQSLDKIFKPHRSNPIAFGKDADLLLFLQRIRDEAHRFAITGHRQRRGKARTTSQLERIPGLGPKRRRELLRQFGGLQGVRDAGVDDLVKVRGISKSLAEKIYDDLHLEGRD